MTKIKKEATSPEIASSKIKAQPNNKINVTVPSHTFDKTSHPDLFRVCDRNGDWTHYFHKPSGRYLPAVNHIISNGYNKGPRFHKYLLSVNPEEAKRALETAGERGTRVHSAIRDLINGVEVKIDSKYPSESSHGRMEPLTGDEWDLIGSFMRWQGEFKPHVDAHEFAVFSLNYGYAGTIDFLGTAELAESRRVVLTDWKTSGKIWDEYKLQISAYYEALLEMNDRTRVTPERTGIVRLAPGRNDGYESKWWSTEETLYHFQVFLSVKNSYEFNRPPKGDEPVIEQIPVSFKANIPKCAPEKPMRKKKSHVVKST